MSTAPQWRKPLVSEAPWLLLAAGLGFVNALALLGWRVIDPRNTAWLTGDNATHYLGWAFYRYEAGWTFPLAWTERVGFPAGASIAFMDSIPLAAILLRPFSAILPEPFQYLGLYATLCFVLQAYFGSRLCRRLPGGSAATTVLGMLVFLLAPPLTWLAFGHFPHLGHWLILAGLDAYLRDTDAPAVRWIGPYWLLLGIAGGVNPYLAVCVLLIAAAAVFRLLLERRCGLGTAALLLISAPAVLAASLFLWGFLATSAGSDYRGPGYGLFSLNLLAPINHMGYGSGVLPALPIIGGEQHEGYNYLGLGVIGLLASSILASPRRLGRLMRPKWLPLVALAIVATALAASSTVTVGRWTILQVQLPAFAAVVTDSLRASGRLFWPVYYLLVLAALWLTLSRWTPRFATVLLASALVLQMVDVWPLRDQVRAHLNAAAGSPLVSPMWRDLDRDHQDLFVIPAYQCGPASAPGGRNTYAIFGMLAASQRMRTNSYYAARYTRRQLRLHCVDVPAEALTAASLNRQAAYVVSDGVRASWEASGIPSHTCSRVDGFNLCVRSDAAQPRTAAPPDAPAYAVGDVLDFTTDGNARRYMIVGWLPQSGPDGTWTEGGVARLRLRLSAPPAGGLSLTLLAARAFVTANHPRLHVDVVVNGQRVDQWLFRFGSSSPRRSATIPPAVVAGRQDLDLVLRFLNPESPLAVGAAPDDRFLGLNVRHLLLEHAN